MCETIHQTLRGLHQSNLESTLNRNFISTFYYITLTFRLRPDFAWACLAMFNLHWFVPIEQSFVMAQFTLMNEQIIYLRESVRGISLSFPEVTGVTVGRDVMGSGSALSTNPMFTKLSPRTLFT